MSLKKEKYVLVKFKLAVYIFQNKTNVLPRDFYKKKLLDGQDIKKKIT